MAEDHPHTIAKADLKSFDAGIGAPAVGTFEIAARHDCDGCRIGSCDMVIVLDRTCQFGICRRLVHWRSFLSPTVGYSIHALLYSDIRIRPLRRCIHGVWQQKTLQALPAFSN